MGFDRFQIESCRPEIEQHILRLALGNIFRFSHQHPLRELHSGWIAEVSGTEIRTSWLFADRIDSNFVELTWRSDQYEVLGRCRISQLLWSMLKTEVVL